MALECLQILKSNMRKARENNDDLRIDMQQCKLQLEELCKKYLVKYTDILTYQCEPQYVDSMVLLLSDKDLTSRYDMIQISDTLYKIALKDLEL